LQAQPRQRCADSSDRRVRNYLSAGSVLAAALGINMKTTNDWRQHLSEQVNGRPDAMYAVQPARHSHYLQRGVNHHRPGGKLKAGACQLWSPAGAQSWR
jgi:hypothetical protein